MRLSGHQELAQNKNRQRIRPAVSISRGEIFASVLSHRTSNQKHSLLIHGTLALSVARLPDLLSEAIPDVRRNPIRFRIRRATEFIASASFRQKFYWQMPPTGSSRCVGPINTVELRIPLALSSSAAAVFSSDELLTSEGLPSGPPSDL